MQLPTGLIEQIRAVASATPGLQRVWLFGSRARGDAAPRADIDLAIEYPAARPADFAKVSLQLSELDTLLPVDVVHLDEAGQEKSRRILRDGVVLYER